MHRDPIATYRLQFNPGFGFKQAQEAAGYLSDLGISHIYASPYFQAVAGSTHGYDVLDHSRVNEELGGVEGHAHFCQTLQNFKLSQMIDIVPNHMAIQGKQNPWWWDVLKRGPSSPFANYFDVDWDSSEERWPNKVLLPVLNDQYGRILEEGGFQLIHNEGIFTLRYQDQIFPVDPSSLVELLSRAADSCQSNLLDFIAESYGRGFSSAATGGSAIEMHEDNESLLLDLLARLCREEPKILEAINNEVIRLNQDPDALDALIEQQNYRLAFWRTASQDLGYRRFFDIKSLAGLRVENPEVFRAIHALPLEWMKKDWIQALRVDHIDGLRDPTGYLCELRKTFPEAWIVVEKILASFEELPNWPVEGTTGYDFLNLMGNLFIDAKGEQALTSIYESFVGEQMSYQKIVFECKRFVLNELLGSELNRLTSLFVHICEQHRRHRDYTRHELQEAILETAVHFPVYRSYITPNKGIIRSEDEEYLSQAIEKAMSMKEDLDHELYSFLNDLLLLKIKGHLEIEFAMHFQQLTGPAMAKGVEDTAFYRFNRLISLNEVGGDPSKFGISLTYFHEACKKSQAQHPFSMLASTTHDTKRSEDVRARLALLSEIPEKWSEAVFRWSNHNARYQHPRFPDRNMEYYLYQTLLGAWPIELERILIHMQKAAREAKLHTSWTHPNEAYEMAMRDFIVAVMKDTEFSDDLASFVNTLLYNGRINSLSQTLIKLTAPGIPDIYQGTELWDLSLCDPDNRKPVDFALRKNLLKELGRLTTQDILARMDQGLPKLWVIQQVLSLRNKNPEFFEPNGSYLPLLAQGSKSDHVVAFIRGTEVITITPRLMMQINGNWDDTMLQLPPGDWHNLLTKEILIGGVVPVQRILAAFPVSLLIRV